MASPFIDDSRPIVLVVLLVIGSGSGQIVDENDDEDDLLVALPRRTIIRGNRPDPRRVSERGCVRSTSRSASEAPGFRFYSNLLCRSYPLRLVLRTQPRSIA